MADTYQTLNKLASMICTCDRDQTVTCPLHWDRDMTTSGIADYETRTIQISVSPKNEPVYSDRATHIQIYDEAGGEFVRLWQESPESVVGIDPIEWPALRQAIDQMIAECRK